MARESVLAEIRREKSFHLARVQAFGKYLKKLESNKLTLDGADVFTLIIEKLTEKRIAEIEPKDFEQVIRRLMIFCGCRQLFRLIHRLRFCLDEVLGIKEAPQIHAELSSYLRAEK